MTFAQYVDPHTKTNHIHLHYHTTGPNLSRLKKKSVAQRPLD